MHTKYYVLLLAGLRSSTQYAVRSTQYEPGEKIEFSSLMYEIKVLPLNYPGFVIIIYINSVLPF